MHFVRSVSLVPFSSLLLLVACSGAPRQPAPPPAADQRPVAPQPASDAANGDAPSLAEAASTAPASRFRCTEIIGLTITAEWYGAGFEQLVDDAAFQARTRPHTFVDQWADPGHEAWTAAVTSPCANGSESPDRVVLFAANWKLTSEEEWLKVLSAFVTTAKARYPKLRDLELYTVLRGPANQSCGDPKSRVEPFIDAAIARVAAREPTLVRAGPRLEAADCAVFDKGGPHFTEAGRRRVAKQLADALR
jgi:hypothetical protein